MNFMQLLLLLPFRQIPDNTTGADSLQCSKAMWQTFTYAQTSTATADIRVEHDMWWEKHLGKILVEGCASGHLGQLPDQHCGITGGRKLKSQLQCQQVSLCPFCTAGSCDTSVQDKPVRHACTQCSDPRISRSAQQGTTQHSTTHVTLAQQNPLLSWGLIQTAISMLS